MRLKPTRGKLGIILAGAAAAGGAAGWLLFGPLWAIAGVVAGPPLALGAYSVAMVYTDPDPVALLKANEPYQALTEVQRALPSWRGLARIWPGQFREPLAINLLMKAEALDGLHRQADALGAAAEAVAIYQVLAAEEPRKFTPGLAGALDRQAWLLAAGDRRAEAIAAVTVAVRLYTNLTASEPRKYLPVLAESLTRQAQWLSEMDLGGQALAAASEAAAICQDRLAREELPRCTAQALLLQGRLLAGQARYREAVRPLARGWQIAAGQQRQDLLTSAARALKAAYAADQAGFAAAWRAETGGEPPDWLA